MPTGRGSTAFYSRKTDYAAELDERPRGAANRLGHSAGRRGGRVHGAVDFRRRAAIAARLPALRRIFPLFESTKSAMRGAISARKREPLNTP